MLERDTLTQVEFLPSSHLVRDVAFSLDSTALVLVLEDGVAQVWDVETGEISHSVALPQHDYEEHPPMLSVVMSPDSHTFAVSNLTGDVWLWDVQGGRPRQMAGGVWPAPLTLIAFSPDGSQLLGLELSQVQKVWDTANGVLVSESDLGQDQHLSSNVAVSPDGLLLARAMEGGSVEVWSEIWDVEAAKQLQVFDDLTNSENPYSVCGLAFSPDSRVLAAQADGRIQLWAVDDGTPIASLEIDGECGWGMAFDPSGQLLVFETAQRLSHPRPIFLAHVWAIESSQVHTVDWELGGVRDWAFSPTGEMLALVNAIGEVRVWNVPDGKVQPLVQNIDSSAVCYSPDGNSLAIAYGPNVQLVAVGNNQAICELGHDSTVIDLGLAVDGTLVVLPETGNLTFWQSGKEAPSQTCQVGRDAQSLTLSPNGEWIAIVREAAVELRRMGDCKLVHTWDGHELMVTRLVFSLDSNYLAAGSSQVFQLWDVRDRRPVHTFKIHLGVWDAHWDQNGNALLAVVEETGDGEITLYNKDGDAPLRVMQATDEWEWFSSLRFSPDGRILASGGGFGTIAFWDIATGNLLHQTEGHRSAVTDLVFSPDGSILMSSSWDDGTTRVWGVPSGK